MNNKRGWIIYSFVQDEDCVVEYVKIVAAELRSDNQTIPLQSMHVIRMYTVDIPYMDGMGYSMIDHLLRGYQLFDSLNKENPFWYRGKISAQSTQLGLAIEDFDPDITWHRTEWKWNNLRKSHAPTLISDTSKTTLERPWEVTTMRWKMLEVA